MSPDSAAVIQRLRDGWDWPLPRRADGWRYWSRVEPPGWEPLTDGEMAVVDAFEREYGEPDPHLPNVGVR